MAGYYNVFLESQTNTAIVTPLSGKRIIIWYVGIDTTETGQTTLVLNDETLATVEGIGELASSYGGRIGPVNGILKISCQPNTTIKVNYDEV